MRVACFALNEAHFLLNKRVLSYSRLPSAPVQGEAGKSPYAAWKKKREGRRWPDRTPWYGHAAAITLVRRFPTRKTYTRLLARMSYDMITIMSDMRPLKTRCNFLR